ncbi:hypothetical protein GWI33_020487 [Rhynchophorus ferrugineus]|uniref:Uncharacterized protein n=1 Tax=Rhynchophorus ferrugineus TaxID=354439 RepID=A0A834M438_RHYFE|nr:hypothetical protein GWI33_020487 [Rhynchophorus ferrugineus]
MKVLIIFVIGFLSLAMAGKKVLTLDTQNLERLLIPINRNSFNTPGFALNDPATPTRTASDESSNGENAGRKQRQAMMMLDDEGSGDADAASLNTDTTWMDAVFSLNIPKGDQTAIAAETDDLNQEQFILHKM